MDCAVFSIRNNIQHTPSQAWSEHGTDLWRFKTRHPRSKVSNNLFRGVKPPCIHMIPHLEFIQSPELFFELTQLCLCGNPSFIPYTYQNSLPNHRQWKKPPLRKSHQIEHFQWRNPLFNYSWRIANCPADVYFPRFCVVRFFWGRS